MFKLNESLSLDLKVHVLEKETSEDIRLRGIPSNEWLWEGKEGPLSLLGCWEYKSVQRNSRRDLARNHSSMTE